MRKLTFLTILAVAVTTAPASAQTACCGNNPPIRSIDRACLPAGAPRPDLPLYMSDLNEKYAEIATIDSYVTDNKRLDTMKKQARDVQSKAQAAGADAVIRVRSLANKVTGWKENPETPFFSVQQGESNDYFVRGTAIKYLVWPKAEPEALAIKESASPAAKQTSPIIDTNQLMKLNTDKRRRYDKTVPEVYSTQPSPGIR